MTLCSENIPETYWKFDPRLMEDKFLIFPSWAKQILDRCLTKYSLHRNIFSSLRESCEIKWAIFQQLTAFRRVFTSHSSSERIEGFWKRICGRIRMEEFQELSSLAAEMHSGFGKFCSREREMRKIIFHFYSLDPECSKIAWNWN